MTAKDPIGLRGGTSNFYQYALLNPTNARDPSGLAPLSECAKAILCTYFKNGFLEWADLQLGIPPWVLGDPSGFAFGSLYLNEGIDPDSDEGILTIGHELVHLAEQYPLTREGLIGWGGMYLAEYLFRRMMRRNGHDDAYRSIRTERQAYAFQDFLLRELATRFPGGDFCRALGYR